MTESSTWRESPWKRWIFVGASFGIAAALLIVLAVAAFVWFKSRPTRWKTDAVKASYASMEFTLESDGLALEFLYDLQNTSDVNYRMDNSPSNLVVMAKLDGDVLSKEIGHYQKSEATVLTPVFIPANAKTRITLRVPYQYPVDDSAVVKRDIDKATEFVQARLRELHGFVVFDQSEHIRIDLPKWPISQE